MRIIRQSYAVLLASSLDKSGLTQRKTAVVSRNSPVSLPLFIVITARNIQDRKQTERKTLQIAKSSKLFVSKFFVHLLYTSRNPLVNPSQTLS
jgi:hypothetical protein